MFALNTAWGYLLHGMPFCWVSQLYLINFVISCPDINVMSFFHSLHQRLGTRSMKRWGQITILLYIYETVGSLFERTKVFSGEVHDWLRGSGYSGERTRILGWEDQNTPVRRPEYSRPEPRARGLWYSVKLTVVPFTMIKTFEGRV